MLDVGDGLLQRQRAEVKADADALPQRRVGWPLQARLEFRLPDQQNRQQVLIVELEIREKADLVKRRLGGNELRFVDDQDRLALLLVQLDESHLNLLH